MGLRAGCPVGRTVFSRQNTYPLSRFSIGRLSLAALGVALHLQARALALPRAGRGTRLTLVLAR